MKLVMGLQRVQERNGITWPVERLNFDNPGDDVHKSLVTQAIHLV